jgi:transcriptional regulator with GAF, ATPase, and Fis domain
VADIKPDAQLKLLRVLEERVFERVAARVPSPWTPASSRPTNRNLIQEVRTGRFREDLYFRLRTVPLSIPPLRERVEDIPILLNHFIAQLNRRYGKRSAAWTPRSWICSKGIPGRNVRELQRVLEYAFVFAKGAIITMTHLPEMEPVTAGEEPSLSFSPLPRICGKRKRPH